MSCCYAVQALIVDHNQLGHLPAQIGSLEQLETLSCSHNLLLSLPETIGKLTKLKFLNCSSNKIISLPAELGKATAVEEINASDNYLQVCLPPLITLSYKFLIRSPSDQLSLDVNDNCLDSKQQL